MVSRLELFKSSPYFSGLNPAELEEISSLVFEKRYDRDEIIIAEEEKAEALYFVASGVVKVFKTSADGKEQILDIIRPEETFNEIPVFNGGLNPASAQAMVPVVVYGIKRGDMEVILRAKTQVALNIINVMAKRLRHLVSLIEELSFKRVISRVAGILLGYAGDGVTSGTRLTQRDMAAMAGTAREVVGRSLKTLAEGGTIRIDRHRIIITDRGSLKKIAEQSL
ncbi:MAG: Crp/Fnr family transcriptional regulator [Dehalococcoidales bacterium]|nr:Crp/Fnr family transcriptional regulator [Dehalococcoidales bacterium]